MATEFRFDTGENEPVKILQNVVKNKLLILLILSNSAIFANFATTGSTPRGVPPPASRFTSGGLAVLMKETNLIVYRFIVNALSTVLNPTGWLGMVFRNFSKKEIGYPCL